MDANDQLGMPAEALGDAAPRGVKLQKQLATVTADVQLLENALHSLPRVDLKGSSDCPFAEDLYAQKEEREAKVAQHVTQLKGYLPALEAEVSRCRENLERIGADAGTLHGPEAVAAFASAEDAQQKEYDEVLRDRDSILMALRRALAVLEVSQRRKFPGKTPERQMAPFADVVTKAAPVETQLPGHTGQLPGKPTTTLGTPGSGSSRVSSPSAGIGGTLSNRGRDGR